MALIPCPECNAQVSTDAFTCPQCGYILKKKANLRLWILMIPLAIVLSIVLKNLYILYLN